MEGEKKKLIFEGKREEKGIKRRKDWGNDYGGYMSAKIRKLDEQFTRDNYESANERRESSTIFNGLAIFINGYTIPPADELRKLFVLHGGRFQQYFSRSSVTHIIATNLPDSKIIEIRDKKVVRPQWILDSIKQGRCLPIDQYLLYSGRQALQKQLNFSRTDHSTHSTLQKTLTEIPKSNSENCAVSLTCQKALEVPNTEEFRDLLPSVAEDEQDFDIDEEGVPGTTLVQESNQIGKVFSPDDVALNLNQEKSNCSLKSLDSDLKTRQCLHDVSESSDTTELPKPENQTNNRSSLHTKTSLEETGPSLVGKEMSAKHPKAGEPNFMNEFYSNSRLHYLSTWGAEFKQFTSDLIKDRINKGIIPHRQTGPAHYGRIIMHIDMDCFFVSVGLRSQPNLVGKPVAVCHAGKASAGKESTSPGKPKMSSTFFTSMSEIASCSYEARKAGVRNGMFLGSARKLCPDILCIPYNFKEYRDVSKKLFETLVNYSHDVEAVSCDEAYIEVTQTLDEQTSPLSLAQKIRKEIRDKTGCNASIGIGSNVLLARMCTRLAKPNGEFYLSADDDILEFVGRQKVTDLPGVGRAQGQKLKSLGINLCADLQKCSLKLLQQSFGEKTGLTLYRSCRGEDDRSLRAERERKSVSAEINYGMRFTKDSEAEHFIDELSREVQKRLKDVGLKGHSVTLKLKVRREGAPEPQKFMGHGICDNIARSAGLQVPTDDSKLIFKKCLSLFRQLRVASSDVRGIGIQVSKLTQSGAVSRTLHDFARKNDSIVNNYPLECQSLVPDTTKNVSVLINDENSELNDVVNSPLGSAPNSFYFVKERSGIPSDQKIKTSLTFKETLDLVSEMHFPPLPRFSPIHTSPPKQEIQNDENFDDLCLPSLSQLDVSTLNALPEEIRLKIEKHYATLKLDEIKPKERHIKAIDNQTPTEAPSSPCNSLGGEVSVSGVKSMIQQWTNTAAPIREDVEVVSQYLVQLIDNKNMEQMRLLVKFLMRCIKKTNNQDWQAAGRDVIDRVQLSFIEHYGAPMVL